MVLASADEGRCDEPAEHGEHAEDLYAMAIGQPRPAQRHRHHGRERCRRPHEFVGVQRGVDGHVQHHEAAAAQRMAEEGETLTHEALPDADERDARQQSRCHAQGLAHPAVVEGELDEVADAQDQRADAGVEQPPRPNPLLQPFDSPLGLALSNLPQGLAQGRPLDVRPRC